MYGEYVYKSQVVLGLEIKYQAFMENDGEITVTASSDNEELKRWVLPEYVAFAIADLFEREESR